jgi:perosamine synthetase
MSTTSDNQPTASADGPLPLCVPHLAGNEWKYVKECLDTNWVSTVGAYVDRFERGVAAQTGVDHAVATVNGTAALHTALMLAGVKPDEEVAISTLTFIATANAVHYTGAHPVLIDAESTYWQMDPELLCDFLSRQCDWKKGSLFNRVTGRRVAAVMPVHILGHPVDFDAISEIAGRFELPVIEDAAEAIGATYKGRPVGSLGQIGCLSFNGNKVITTGGGGMLVTDNHELATRAKYLTTTAKDDPVEYIHGDVGYNYRMPNILAALGCAQLEQLAGFIARKRKIAANYRQRLQQIPGVTLQAESPDVTSTCWLSTVEFDAAEFGVDRQTVRQTLLDANIHSRPFWQPMHQSPVYGREFRVVNGVSDRLYANCLSLPSSVTVTESDQQRVISAIESLAASGQRRRQIA